ncbi:SMI1/KNR4 family protein [Bacillus sp. SJS]|uniref:SMI1/KNR4 family protein n=1 Tax=Bacillus sp. SJS TaxID=1423321 RepID=UPI0004DCBC0D|nr:SMI1/KNR4 family protein [Bacillus sp. SJS]KZZ83918.1 SMI1 / KNR4 family protein [Bacillus sp. SJS]
MNIKSYGNINPEKVNSFEQFIGFALPHDYRNFLLKHNGGSIRGTRFSVKELNEEISLHVLYGISTDNSDLSLESWYEEYEEDLMSNALIIGHDRGSGMIVLINDSENNGVYFWDHAWHFEQSDEDNNTYKISDSFNSFIEKLETE